MFVKAWGRDKAEVDLSFGRRGRYAMDRIRELEDWAQLAARLATGCDSPILGKAAMGAVTVQPLDAARLHFPSIQDTLDGLSGFRLGCQCPTGSLRSSRFFVESSVLSPGPPRNP